VGATPQLSEGPDFRLSTTHPDLTSRFTVRHRYMEYGVRRPRAAFATAPIHQNSQLLMIDSISSSTVDFERRKNHVWQPSAASSKTTGAPEQSANVPSSAAFCFRLSTVDCGHLYLPPDRQALARMRPS
jgi:hypothetical protein